MFSSERHNVWPIKNAGLRILEISLSNFDMYTWIFLQKIAREILYKNLSKRALPTSNYEIISDQHFDTPKWATFKYAFL